jgi:hypothetical protein
LELKNAMVVRIRFGMGPLVSRRKGKNARIAILAASVLTLGAVCLATLGLWRLSEDVDFGGDFVFQQGLLSHWQVWIAAAIGAQYAAWHLTRYARSAQEAPAQEQPAELVTATPEDLPERRAASI